MYCITITAQDWSIISSIATALSAIGTFLAVFVALNQTKLSTTEKLRIKLNPIMSMTGSDLVYVCITISNLGFLTTTIKGISISNIKHKKKKKSNVRYILFTTPYIGSYNAKIERNDSLLYAITTADTMHETLLKEIREKRYSPNDRLFIIIDTATSTHKIKTQFTIGELLEMMKNPSISVAAESQESKRSVY